MLSTLVGLLALLRAPPVPTARPAVMRAPAARAVATAAAEDRVVGQVAGSNPTDALNSGKLYSGKEIPPVWGGLKVGTRRLVIVTGVRARRRHPTRRVRALRIAALGRARWPSRLLLRWHVHAGRRAGAAPFGVAIPARPPGGALLGRRARAPRRR